MSDKSTKSMPTLPWWTVVLFVVFLGLVGVGIAKQDQTWFIAAFFISLPIAAAIVWFNYKSGYFTRKS